LNRIIAQFSEVSVNRDFNGRPLSELIKYSEVDHNLQFFYLNKWTDSIYVIQKETPSSLEQILNQSLKSTKLTYFVYNQIKVIITYQYLIETASLSPTAEKDQVPAGENKFQDISSFINKEQTRPASTSTQNSLVTIGITGNAPKTSRVIITGKVREKETGQPVISAVLFIKNLNLGTVTDATGYYVLSIPPGRYDLLVKYVGRKDQNIPILVNGSGSLDVLMDEKMVELRDVVITADREQNIRGLQLGMEKLDNRQIKQIPSTFGEADLIKTTLLLPGVQTVGEGASGFNVRGGGTDQNLILMDGAPLFNSSHMFGFYSVFNSDVVKDFELYKSSIPAHYGGRLSSVLDVTIKDGNFKKVNVNGGISPVAGRLFLEGPVIKDKVSFLLSGRSTYSDWIMQRTKISVLRNSEASFYDLNGKLDIIFNDKNQLTLSSYLSSDQFNLRTDTLYRYSNLIGSINLKHTFSKTLYGLFSGIYSKYDYSVRRETSVPYSFELSYLLKYLETKADFTWFLNSNHKMRFGADIINYKINPGKIDSLGSESQILPKKLPDENALETGIFISDEHTVTNELAFSYGLRYSAYFSLGPELVYKYLPDAPRSLFTRFDSIYYPENKITYHAGGPEFRLSARYKTGPSSSVKISYTKMFQYLQMISNTTAVSPTDTWKTSGPNLPVQKSHQFSIGFYKDLMANTIESSVEVYYKTLKNVLEYRGGATLIMNPNLEIDLLNGTGKAYGMEILFKKKYGALNGWVCYTYSRSLTRVDSRFLKDQINGGNYYPSNFDKPHDFTLVANYRFSRIHSFSTTIKYNTGRPITYPVAKYLFRDREFVHYSDRNEYRISDYFRVDVSYNIDGRIKANKLGHGSTSISVYNLTGRKNLYSVFFVSETARSKVKGYKLSIFSRPIPSITYNFMF
jgi:hypothetical protein